MTSTYWSFSILIALLLLVVIRDSKCELNYVTIGKLNCFFYLSQDGNFA